MNVFKNLFKESGVKDVITLFHAPNSAASVRIYTLLKQAAAQSNAHATEDQASSHDTQSQAERTEFDLDVQEGAPTADQVTNILEYVGPSKAGTIIRDATGGSDALRRFKENEKLFQRPIVVDWNHGRAVAGDNESEIMKLVKSIPKESEKV